MSPLLLRAHHNDDVAIVVEAEGLRCGAHLPDGFTIREDIPQAHKVALRDFDIGDPVHRFGHVIGYVTRSVSAGGWVRNDAVRPAEPPQLHELALATAIPDPQVPLNGYSFMGFRNVDGSAGTRNTLGILSTVQCVAPMVEHAVRRLKAEVLPRFASVDDIIAVVHGYGCGVAIDAPGSEIPIRTLSNISTHANFGSISLIVSLGCEKLQPERLFQQDARLPVLDQSDVIRIQDHRGFQAAVAEIMAAAEKRLAILNRRQRVRVPASELVVGLQCGGSDAFSGVTCNPAVGFAADLLVRAGATVMFSEVTEVRDAVHLLTPRAINVDVARALVREMEWYDDYLARHGADRSANPTPGNLHGGIANILEKSLGSVAKAGSSAIRAVAGHGERVRAKGLVFAATPASDFVCGTQQLTSMNMHVFTTGEGSPYGLALVPVIKVSSRTTLAERWPDLIDVDAGTIATGRANVQDVGWNIFRFILEVASGKKTWAEHWRLHNALVLFNPSAIT